jgi:hypothetical protein
MSNFRVKMSNLRASLLISDGPSSIWTYRLPFCMVYYKSKSTLLNLKASLHLVWNLVCLLVRASYGLCQSPRMWHSRMETYLLSLGMVKSNVDANLYYKLLGTTIVLPLLYVDNLCNNSASPATLRRILLSRQA